MTCIEGHTRGEGAEGQGAESAFAVSEARLNVILAADRYASLKSVFQRVYWRGKLMKALAEYEDAIQSADWANALGTIDAERAHAAREQWDSGTSRRTPW